MPGADEEQFEDWTWSRHHISEVWSTCAGQNVKATYPQVEPKYVNALFKLKLSGAFFPDIGRFEIQRGFAIFRELRPPLNLAKAFS